MDERQRHRSQNRFFLAAAITFLKLAKTADSEDRVEDAVWLRERARERWERRTRLPCEADCVRDGHSLRPIDNPRRLVWTYFEVHGLPDGTLEPREFEGCPCLCGGLIARPAVGTNTHASIKAP